MPAPDFFCNSESPRQGLRSRVGFIFSEARSKSSVRPRTAPRRSSLERSVDEPTAPAARSVAAASTPAAPHTKTAPLTPAARSRSPLVDSTSSRRQIVYGVGVSAAAPSTGASTRSTTTAVTTSTDLLSCEHPAVVSLNGVPYFVHEKLGSGGSAEVFCVELLVPRFTAARRRDDGDLEINESGAVLLDIVDPRLDENDIDDDDLIPSGVRYALKVVALPTDSVKKARELRAIHAHEISLLGMFRECDGVVRIYDSEVRRDAILILLELAVCDLGSWLASRGGGQQQQGSSSLLTPGQILDIWSQLVEAVAAIHAKSVIHFDVKPRNVLVMETTGPGDSTLNHPQEHYPPVSATVFLPTGETPLLKLADFGLARRHRDSVSHISADGGWGTLKYMAPEVVHQPTADNFRFRNVVDVWGLGVILHQLLHGGETPYEYLLRRNDARRLAFGIADQRALKTNRDCEWIVQAVVGEEETGGKRSGHLSSRGSLLRDFFLATQEACLCYDYSERVSSGVLKQQLAELREVLETGAGGGKDLEEGSEGDVVSSMLRGRPALAELLHGSKVRLLNIVDCRTSSTSKKSRKRHAVHVVFLISWRSRLHCLCKK